MKAVLEPNEILIQTLPSQEAPLGYYYTLQTKNIFRFYDDLPELLDEIERRLKSNVSAPKITEI